MRYDRAAPMILSRLLAPAERLLAALADPARRERTALGVIAAYVAVWTLYGVFAKASQDIHFDMAELFAWAHTPALGYAKHPPLAAWLVHFWFALFPAADWAYYLLATVTSGAGLLLAWRLAGRYLDGEKRALALALLTLVPLYNFQALKFNPNTVLIPLWALTTLWFIRSYESRSAIAALIAGVAAAGAMLGKYWSIFLIIGLVLAALLDPRRKSYFLSAAPWITIVAGAMALMPHLYWLFVNDFTPFSYALAVHGSGSLGELFKNALGYLAGGFGYVAAPVLLALAATRPDRAACADFLWPPTPARRLAATAFWAPLLLPALLAPVFGFGINSLWTMSAWSLLPVVLLSSPLAKLSHAAAVRMIALAIVLPFVFLAASPFVAYRIHQAGVAPAAAHANLLAERVAQAWKSATARPLRLVSGDADLAYGVAFYLPERPRVVLLHELASSVPEAMVCPEADRACVARIVQAGGTEGRRSDVELTRSYFGIAGVPARYVIVLVPR